MSIDHRGAATWVRCGLTVLALCAGASHAAPLYRIAEMPDVADTSPLPQAINDDGVVVGTLYPTWGNRRAYRWQEGGALELAPLENPKLAQFAVSVDRAGAVSYSVGWPGNTFPGKHLRTEVWGRGSTVAKRLPGIDAYFGNTAGDLVIDGDTRVYALRERNGTLTEIDAPVRAEMFDINNRQQVVGTSGGRPVSWSVAGGLRKIPALQDEPLVAAKAVNDAGDVVLMTGPFELALNDPKNAPNAVYFWSASTGVQALGSHANCAWYEPRKVNAQKTAVGSCYAQATPISEQYAFAWNAESGIYLLESQVDPVDPLVGQYRIQRAVGINRSGQVLVEATHKTQHLQRVLVLTPVQ